MTRISIEELNNLHKEERRLWYIHEGYVKAQTKARDEWYLAYRRWLDAEEEQKINKLVEEKIGKVYHSAPDEI